jgi:Cytochrome P460/Haem-binding domain
MTIMGKLAIAALGAFAVLQAVRPSIPARPPTAEVQASPEVTRILERNCYSCHSDQRRLSWFDEIVPGYWLVRRDIMTAREHLNFSTLGSKPVAMQKAALYEAVNMIQLGAMPLPAFVRLHPESRVSPEELDVLKEYLAPWATAPSQLGTGQTAADNSLLPRVSLAGVEPEFNGLAFDADFESWKLIGTTDRGDNNTFRFIFGNEVAVRAARSGNISPWPDGSRFAKVAWQQELGPDGLLHSGKFIQVELMVKDAKRYKDTEGWGWGRWRGLDLKPYGKNAAFVNECTACHRPLQGNDYVYTLPIANAQVGKLEIVNNRAATLPTALPYQPLDWNPITMYVDAKTHTTATLFGNEAAFRSAQRRGDAIVGESTPPNYPAGAVLALVTWGQRDDPHWFGAGIPDTPQSVEFVQVSVAGQTRDYRRFGGPIFSEDHLSTLTREERTAFLLGLVPMQVP